MLYRYRRWGRTALLHRIVSGFICLHTNLLLQLCSYNLSTYVHVFRRPLYKRTRVEKNVSAEEAHTCTCRSNSCSKHRAWRDLYCILEKLRFPCTWVSNQQKMRFTLGENVDVGVDSSNTEKDIHKMLRIK